MLKYRNNSSYKYFKFGNKTFTHLHMLMLLYMYAFLNESL